MRLLVAAAAGWAMAPTLGCAGATATGPPPAIALPIATSVTTSAGTWASVPMGHLKQHLNTFWQLFFQRAGAKGGWKDVATRLAVATNGGVLLSEAPGAPLVVAVRPSNQLHFTALVTSVGGRTWSPRRPVDGTVSSLATSGDQVVALVKSRSGGRVVTSSGGAWKDLVSAMSLASSGGRRCAPLVLTAVATDASGNPLIGASCGGAGAVGIFSERAGRWRSVGPAVGSPTAHVEVVSLSTTDGRTNALLAVATGSTTLLVDGILVTARWRLSEPLVLGAETRLVSTGPSPSGGVFVLSASRSGRERLAVSSRLGRRWALLPRPPEGTESVAFAGSGRVDAFVVGGTVMTDWVLDSGASSWTKGKASRVRILFGSSTI
ncbi:MAG TPA: hypothetical protein VND62_05170 [Acidimicrobiales bacterium]|nr:hypothetical protein [Acidimicrobiales bacterium]